MTRRAFKWARRASVSYEVSSKGDRRFSAFYAILPSGESVEHAYQCGVKGYPSIQEGKGKAPRNPNTDTWKEYLNLWRIWANNNLPLMRELFKQATLKDYTLSDMFATTGVNQARALATILNELINKG